ncbi:hypothetical protein EV421DRAFT_1911701 [Armillaria borealis]|uniref:Uncharacterized protein n=1 Tax=Armillaria borealis TaxID=47425 RepID=A0AA39IXG7_9AGAR|nr:hypothetical protein EV421DRAFT_1911701 [Armillaria borealis]
MVTNFFDINRYIMPPVPSHSPIVQPAPIHLYPPTRRPTPFPSQHVPVTTTFTGSGTESSSITTMEHGPIPASVPLDNITHIPDVIREDNVSSSSTSSRTSSTWSSRAASPSREPTAPDSQSPLYHPRSPSPAAAEWIARQGMGFQARGDSPSPEPRTVTEFSPTHRSPSSDGNTDGPSHPPPHEFTPIPYHLTVNPEPYSQEPSPSPTDYTHEPSPVPMVRIWRITNGIIGGTSPPSMNSKSSNGSG